MCNRILDVSQIMHLLHTMYSAIECMNCRTLAVSYGTFNIVFLSEACAGFQMYCYHF